MKVLDSFLSIRERVLKTLLFSLVLIGFSKMPVKACEIDHSQSFLLGEAPVKLNGANFMGEVELIRVFGMRENPHTKVIARAIVKRSSTHPHFVGKKMLFFYTAPVCSSTVSHPGDLGFAIGRALKLGSEILYVTPYVLSFKELEMITENESIPLSEFYVSTP